MIYFAGIIFFIFIIIIALKVGDTTIEANKKLKEEKAKKNRELADREDDKKYNLIINCPLCLGNGILTIRSAYHYPDNWENTFYDTGDNMFGFFIKQMGNVLQN